MTSPATAAQADRAADQAVVGTGFTLLAALGFAAVSTLTSVAISGGAVLPTVLAWRYVLAAVVMTGFVGVRGYPRVRGRELTKFLVIGGGGQALLVGLALSSIAYIPVATLAFLFYTYPAWVSLVQAMRGAERMTGQRLGALALSFGGIVVIAGAPSAGSVSGNAIGILGLAPFWSGVVLALSAAIVYGAYIPTMQAMQKTHPVAVTSALSKIGAAVCFLLWSVGSGGFDYALSARSWLAIAALVLFSTVLPSVFFLMGLMRLGPVRTAIVSTIEPFLTAVIGVLALGQALTWRTAVGGAMIVAAVALLQFKRERVA
ncbi:MAG: DMT family transporter [Gemmatimonadetes bacterium]|nr:DMT family transporter [Gemmatimonadota bacterium]